MNEVLKRLLAQRQEQIDFIQNLLEQVETANRDLVDAERANIDAARERIEELDEQIGPLQQFAERASAHQESAAQIQPTRPATTNGGEGRQSLGVQTRETKYDSPGAFVVDYLKARGQRVQGGQEISPDHDARQRVEASLGRSLTMEERAIAHQTTENTPGLLPVSIVGEILQDLDAARPLVSSVGAKPLGSIPGKKFRRPKITQHTQVGEQSAEKAELPSRQLVIGDVEFDKRTFGGALNISRQDIDWTSPSAWNAIISDLQLVYGAETEDWAAEQMADGVSQTVTIPAGSGENMKAWIKALYEAATMAATANETKRASALRLPDTIWTSIDMWGSLGAMLSSEKMASFNPPGRAKPNVFAGDILEIERVVVPGLPTGTFIIGRKSLFEFYEERIGLLSAVEPKVLGIEVAYGGYVAAGHMDATAFAKVTVGA